MIRKCPSPRVGRNSPSVVAPTPLGAPLRSRAKGQSLRFWGSEENRKSEALHSGQALGSWLQVRQWKSSSLQVLDGGLPARDQAGEEFGGLGHPGRAREKSFRRWERNSHVEEYVGVRAQVQEVESHLGEKLRGSSHHCGSCRERALRGCT